MSQQQQQQGDLSAFGAGDVVSYFAGGMAASDIFSGVGPMSSFRWAESSPQSDGLHSPAIFPTSNRGPSPCMVYYCESSCMCMLISSEQTIFDSMRPDPAVMAGLDPGIATICTVDQQPPSLNWEDAYASAGLLSALIPSTPFPLDEDQQAS